MTVACPAGHVSEGSDFCDECGVRIGAIRLGAWTTITVRDTGAAALLHRVVDP